LHQGHSACYVTKNGAPKAAFAKKLLEGNKKLKYIKGLFKSPVSFENSRRVNAFDCILIDEAHRLMVRYGNSQIRDLIEAALVSVFFIDEDQRVTTKDIGSKQEIFKIAKEIGATVISNDNLTLQSQFRCNGSDGYIAFLDNLLGIKETANSSLDGLDYDFRIYDDPVKMRDDLRILNNINNKSRMVAGYCYDWISKNNSSVNLFDIKLKNNFNAQWNFGSTSTWAIDEDSFEQVGCIHTSQGLEFDYVGVIIGNDLKVENGKIITDQNAVASTDFSSGIRTCKSKDFADKLIKNTYKTLMTRGQKGCFVYCEDDKLSEYMRKYISENT